MKVLLATIFNYPHIGGLSSHIDMLSRELIANGHDADIVSYNDVIPWFESLAVEMSRNIGVVSEQNRYYIKSMKSMWLTVEERLRTRAYDVINAQDPMALYALKDIDIPKVVTVHGYLTYENLSSGRVNIGSAEESFLLDMEKRSYRASDEVVAVDTGLKEHIKSISNIDAIVIKNFVDTCELDMGKYDYLNSRSDLGIKAEKRVLFCPRRLTEKNGIIYPAMAVNQLRSIFPDIILYYSADGEQKEMLENYIAINNLSKHIMLLGEISRQQMMKYYKASDIILIPSICSKGAKEDTSISALEAMAFSKPVIASAVGGLKEIIINGESGLLIEEGNVSQLSDRIMRLLLDRKLYIRISKHARERVVKEFHISSGVSKYIDVYNSIRN